MAPNAVQRTEIRRVMMSETTVRRSRPTKRQQVFRLEGEYWTVQYDGVVCRLRDGKGMQYLAAQLARPGERIAVTDLVHASVEHASTNLSRLSAAGPGRRSAASAHELELARVNVTRTIKTALRRIAMHHPALGAHLSATVRTGVFCLPAGPARADRLGTVSG